MACNPFYAERRHKVNRQHQSGWPLEHFHGAGLNFLSHTTGSQWPNSSGSI